MSVSVERGVAVIGTAAVHAVAGLVTTAGLCAKGASLCARGAVWAVGQGVKVAKKIHLKLEWLNESMNRQVAELEELLLESESPLQVASGEELAGQFAAMKKRAEQLASKMPELSEYKEEVARYAALRTSQLGQFARAEDWSALLRGPEENFQSMMTSAVRSFQVGQATFIRNAVVEAASAERFADMAHESHKGDKQQLVMMNQESGQGFAVELKQTKEGTQVKLDILSDGPDCQGQMQRILARLQEQGIRLRSGRFTKHFCRQGVEVARSSAEVLQGSSARPAQTKIPTQPHKITAPKRVKRRTKAKRKLRG
jgi:hypothetical protein